MERQLTSAPHGHILTNTACWSADGQWLVYDTRSDAAGSQFDGRWIERVHVKTGRVQRLYESQHGACCGVVTCCPVSERVLFILGPERPTPDWQYSAYHRRGVLLQPGEDVPRAVDAMCYAEPFVEGALRGGSHVHTFDGLGQCVAFTYEDHVLATHPKQMVLEKSTPTSQHIERNQRNVGISVPCGEVDVPPTHARNHSGSHFSVLLTRTWDEPEPGSDQIDRAYEDAWVGQHGYSGSDRYPDNQLSNRPDSCELESHAKRRAIAFLGDVVGKSGDRHTELFLVDVPADVKQKSEDGPLAGTLRTRPRPPRGTNQRRLTFTEGRPFPGVSGPRHWPRSTPDGSHIFFLMRAADGFAQLWSIAPLGGQPVQLTRLHGGVTSAFSVSHDGLFIAHMANGCVCVTSVGSGTTRRLTQLSPEHLSPRPEACVFSPDDQQIAYVRPVANPPGTAQSPTFNQLFVVDF